MFRNFFHNRNSNNSSPKKAWSHPPLLDPSINLGTLSSGQRQLLDFVKGTERLSVSQRNAALREKPWRYYRDSKNAFYLEIENEPIDPRSIFDFYGLSPSGYFGFRKTDFCAMAVRDVAPGLHIAAGTSITGSESTATNCGTETAMASGAQNEICEIITEKAAHFSPSTTNFDPSDNKRLSQKASGSTVLVGPNFKGLADVSREMFSVKEVMHILDMSHPTFYRRRKTGVIKTTKQGGRTFVTRAELMRYISMLEM